MMRSVRLVTEAATIRKRIARSADVKENFKGVVIMGFWKLVGAIIVAVLILCVL